MTKGIQAVALSLLLFASTAVQAAMWEFAGFMDDEQATTSAVPDPYFGGGFVSATLDTVTGVFEYFVTFGGLTSPEFVSHFHLGPPGVPGPVALGLSGRAGSPTAGSYSDVVVLDASDIDELTTVGGLGLDPLSVGDPSLWYVNVHTDDWGGGEIRGQLIVTTVPLPAAAWLLLPAIGMIAGVRRCT